MTTTFFAIEQSVHGGATWELVQEGRSETLEGARADLASLENELGWRDLRIVERAEDDSSVWTVRVVEYGQESDEDDEDDES